MTVFGNPMGPIYPLGLISVATAGTPVALSANVAITTALGTPLTGVPGLTKVGVPSQVQANQIKINAPSTNTGDVFLVFKSQAASAGSGTSVIVVIPKGQERTVGAPAGSSPFQVDKFGLDAATNGDGAYVTLIICN
jgi:hypothetical protein